MPRPIILPEGRQVSPVPHSARSQNSTTTPALISNAPGPVGAWWSEEAEESSERERERAHGRRRADESSLSSPQPLNPVFLSSPVMLATLCLWWWQFMHDSSKFFIRLITHSNTQLGGLLPMGLPVPRPVMRDDDWIKQELYGPLVHLPSPSTLANTMLYSAAGRCIWNYQNYTPFQYQNQVVIIYLNITINNKKGSHTFIEHMCVRLVIALMILQNKKAWQHLSGFFCRIIFNPNDICRVYVSSFNFFFEKNVLMQFCAERHHPCRWHRRRTWQSHHPLEGEARKLVIRAHS